MKASLINQVVGKRCLMRFGLYVPYIIIFNSQAGVFVFFFILGFRQQQGTLIVSHCPSVRGLTHDVLDTKKL